MARFDTSGLDDLIREMRRMGQDSGAVAEAMVNAAVIEIRDAWRESAEEHGLRDTGAMIESIGFNGPVKSIGDALYQDVYPQGKDDKGVRNVEKAFLLHYGTGSAVGRVRAKDHRSTGGLKATYWVDDADEKSGQRVQRRLEEMWGEFLETGKVPAVTDAGGGSAGGGITKTLK